MGGIGREADSAGQSRVNLGNVVLYRRPRTFVNPGRENAGLRRVATQLKCGLSNPIIGPVRGPFRPVFVREPLTTRDGPCYHNRARCAPAGAPFCVTWSPLAQWQSVRLLTEMLMVRVHHGELCSL